MRDISFEGLRTEEIPGAGVTTNDGNTSNKTTCTNVFARIYTLQRLKHTHTQTSSPSTNNKEQTPLLHKTCEDFVYRKMKT